MNTSKEELQYPLNPSILLPGDILHVRGSSLFPAKAIRWCLNNHVWGNHDSIIIQYNERFLIGETEPPWSRLIPLDNYNRELLEGKIEVKILRVPNVTESQRQYASHWWVNNVQGRLYDFAAYPRLIGKCAVNGLLNIFSPNRWRELINTEAGWRWASFCSEGVVDAWAAAGYEICPNTANPTPLHIEHALKAGRLQLVATLDKNSWILATAENLRRRSVDLQDLAYEMRHMAHEMHAAAQLYRTAWAIMRSRKKQNERTIQRLVEAAEILRQHAEESEAYANQII